MTSTLPTATQDTWQLHLPHSKPPLSMNDSSTPMVRRGKVARVRREAKNLATDHALPHLERARIALHYIPRDNRRRDAINLCATLKACVDGFVDAGVLDDDDDTRLVTPMPRIHHARRGQPGQLLIVIRALAPATVHHLPDLTGTTTCCGRGPWEIPRWDRIVEQPVLDGPNCTGHAATPLPA